MIKFCSLYSGSSGNAIFVSCGKTKILVDAGLSGKRIQQSLASIGEDPRELSAVLVSHEHIDHIRGAGVLSRRFNLPVFANQITWEHMESEVGRIELRNRMSFTTGNNFCFQDFNIRPFPIPHDAGDPVGFNLFAEDRKITVATDIGHMTRQLLDFMDESDLLLLESNHDIEMLRVGPYPWSLKQRILGSRGHLSNDMAGKVVAYYAEKGTKIFLLGHLSRENNFPELAYRTVCNVLETKQIKPESDITLEVAYRDRASSVMTI